MTLKSGRRAARAAAALAATFVGASLIAAPQASADTTAAYQTGFELAYANGGKLALYNCTWNTGCGPTVVAAPALAPNTSPSIAKVGARNYEVAYQGANGDLWITGSLGAADLNLAMMPGTSPAIASVKGSYDVAFQGANGDLWTTGERGTFDWHRPMDQKSSPTIMAVPPGDPVENGTEFVVAFENSSDLVEERGWANAVFPYATAAPGTSPSVAEDPAQGFINIAYQAQGCGVVNVILGTDPAPIVPLCIGNVASPGSSPIESDTPPTVYNPQGGHQTGFSSKDGLLSSDGNEVAGPIRTPRHNNGIQVRPGSNSIVLGITLPAYLGAGPASGYEGIYTDNTGQLRYVLGSAFTSKYLDPASSMGAIDPGTNPSVISFQ